MNAAADDVICAIRGLRKTPGFSAVLILTLGLGIGATSAIFSVVNAVLLRPLPYRNAERLVFIWSTSETHANLNLTPGRLIDFREQMTSVSDVAGISHISFNLTGHGDPERVAGSSVSSNFFDLLGVPPLLGDTFHAGRAGDFDVVLGHGLWTRRFGADERIVGREILLNGTARRVAAVMPRAFEWPVVTGSGSSNAGTPQLWVPAARHDVPRLMRDDPQQDLASNRRTGYLRAVARLKDGFTIEQARRQADALAGRLALEHPQTDAGRGAAVQPLREQFFGVVREPLLVLLAAVAFVLAIACANAASLQIGRASSRRRDIAVRLALGAGRARIVRSFLIEAAVLSLAGAATGLLIARWGTAWLVAMAPDDILRLEGSGIDARVLGFTLAVAVLTACLFGIVSAWQAAGSEPAGEIASGGTRASAGRRTTRVHDALVALQVGVSLVLLVGAGLLLRSFVTLARVETGLETRQLLTFELFLSGARAEAVSRRAPFYDDVLRELRALPGVRAAGGAVTLPIGGDDFGTSFSIEGRPALPGQEPTAGYQIVTPGYFGAIGMTVKAGRDFDSRDTAGSPRVVLVNETLARQQWPGADPVGRRVRFGQDAGDPWSTVIGVVSDIRHLGPAAAPRPEIYEVHTQSPFSFMVFVVSTSGEPYALVPSIRLAVARLDPAQPVSGVRTMDEHLARSIGRPRFLSTLTTVFGSLALLLAAIGLYGLMAHMVTLRTREIAIRSALGAHRRAILRLVLVRALVLSAAGAAAGVLATVPLTRLIAGLLFEVAPYDVATYVLVILLLLAVGLTAALIPARRAASIDPIQALRSE
jgi:putative ABC transport system permease protein